MKEDFEKLQANSTSTVGVLNDAEHVKRAIDVLRKMTQVS